MSPTALRLSVMMFLQFFVWGAWYVTVGNYMKEIGLGDSIAWVYTVGPIAAIISPLFLGLIADRFFASERVLGVMHVLAGVALLFAPQMADLSHQMWVASVTAEVAEGADPALVDRMAVLVQEARDEAADHNSDEEVDVAQLGLVEKVIQAGADADAAELAYTAFLIRDGLGRNADLEDTLVARGVDQEKAGVVATEYFINPFHLPFIGLVFLHMLCYMPTLGLTNTLTFHNIVNQETEFPVIRVFGTFGWIAANIVVSAVLHADTSAIPLQIAGGAALVLGVYSFTLPHTPPPAAGSKFSFREALGLDAIALMKDPSFAVFIVSSLLICIPLASYYAFAPVFVGDAGLSDPAFKMSFGQMSEVFFMVAMPLFFARLGVKKMLLVGMLAWVLRYCLFGFASGAFWMITGAIVLHGICYDFFFVTGFIYVDQRASKEIRGQAQGFLVLVTQGIGLAIGAQFAGGLVTELSKEAAVDWYNFWMTNAFGAALVAVSFALLFEDPKKVDDETDGGDHAATPTEGELAEAASESEAV